MDDDLRQLERAAAQDPSLEGQLLSALVRSGQLDRDRLYMAALLYHRGARDALGWPTDAPIDQGQASADGAIHLIHRVYLGPKLDRARKVGPSELRPRCGAIAVGAAPSTQVVTCAECLRSRVAHGDEQVVTASHAIELVSIPGDLHVDIRAAWIAGRAQLAAEERAESWSHEFELVAAWLAEPVPANLDAISAALDIALAAEDPSVTCAWLAVHGGRDDHRILHDQFLKTEALVGAAGMRELLARLGAWVVGRGPDPVLSR